MKRLIIILAAFSFAACSKEKKACWTCTEYSYVVSNKGGTPTYLPGAINSNYCKKTETDIRDIRAGIVWDKPYGDTATEYHQFDCVESK